LARGSVVLVCRSYFFVGSTEGCSMIRPCSSSHQSARSQGHASERCHCFHRYPPTPPSQNQREGLPAESYFQPAGAFPPFFCSFANRSRYTPRGPGSSTHRPHLSAPIPDDAAGSPRAAMNWMRGTFLNSGLSWSWVSPAAAATWAPKAAEPCEGRMHA